MTKQVVVLGGGISGLSATYYLSKLKSTLNTTLIEKSDRLGGWIRSNVAVAGMEFLFEKGPRSLRVAGTLNLHSSP